MSRWLCAMALPVCLVVHAQIPAQEDLETKSKRDPFQEGLEMREVRESSAKDVGEALAKIDGVWKLRKGGVANDVVLRGFQGANLTLTIDGARIYGACPGHMDPAAFHVDFAEVERVEVTKGSFDLANQGSLGGSVNVIRKRLPAGFHLTPSLQLGSFGYVNPSLSGAAGSDRFQVQAGYSYRRSAPFRDGAGQRMTTGAGYRPQSVDDAAYSIQTGWAALRFSLRQGQSGEISYTRQDGAGILYPYLQMDAPYDIADRLGANYRIGDRVHLQAYYTRVIHWMTDEKRASSLTARAAYSMATFAHTRVAGGRGMINFTKDLTGGFELYQRNWDAVNSFRTAMMFTDQNIIPNVNTTVAGAYLEWSRRFTDRLRLTAGARFDTANMYVQSSTVNVNLFEAYKGVSNLQRRDTNPSANIRINYGLSGSWEAFAGLGTTVRLPDAQERFFNHRRMGTDWVGNPALAPTRNTEASAGLTFRRRGFYLKPLLFLSGLNDYIAVHNQARIAPRPTVMNTMARSYAGVDARIYGGEVSLGMPLGTRWLLSGGASYSRGGKDADPALAIFSTNLPEMPPLKARTALRYGNRTWFAEAEGVAASAQRRTDTDLGEIPTAGYAIANAKFGVHVKHMTLTLGVDNLFDRYYREHLSFQRDPFRTGFRVPEPGRNLFVSVGYAF